MPSEPRRPVVRLRPAEDADAPAVLALNEAHVEMLAPMDRRRFDRLRALADRFAVVEVDGGFGGFVVTFAPGAAYDSENYRWFAARHERFYYLDRVVLLPSLRRRGVGSQVYDALEQVAARFGRMTLEVNVVPPNAASLAFHSRRGYGEVGRLGDASHLVSLMEKPLAGL